MKQATRSLKRLALSAVIGGVLAMAAGPVSGALVAHYRFNDNLNDETGNHNAALRDPAETAFFEPGKEGNAVVIHNPGTSLNVSDPSSIDFGTKFTIAAWINYQATGERCLVYKGAPGSWVAGNKQFNLYAGGDLGENGLFFHTQGQGAFGTSFLADNAITLNDLGWHFVAVTYDGTNTDTNAPRVTLWVDGIAKHWNDPGRYTHAAFPSEPLLQPDLPGTVLRIGGREAGGGDYTAFSGLIDELQIYNRALTTNEMLQLFNNPGQVIPPPVIPEMVKDPQSQTVTIGPTVGATVSFSAIADGQGQLSYQWQFNGANLAGETNTTLTVSVVNTNQAGPYTVVASNASGSVTSAAATLTVILDNTPPTIVSARTAGSATSVTIIFSEPVGDLPGSASFAIDNGVTVSGVTRDTTNTIILTTSTISLGQTYTLTIVNGVKDIYGNEIVANSTTPIDLSVDVPMEYGLNVNGFQDDFSGATRDPNWVPVPADRDLYVQANGVLNITTMTGNPNHLLYEAPGYSNEDQEVLLRIRFRTLAVSGASAIVGAAVAANPDDAHPGAGINFLLCNAAAEVGTTAPNARFLNDYIAWGPVVPNLTPQYNTWYWLRVRQTSSSTAAGANLFAKAWLADGTASEPLDWQVSWSQAGRMGFAGIKGPSDNGATDADVDYFLIKAAGLPSIRMAPGSFTLVAPSTPNITQQPQNVSTPVRTVAVFTVVASGKNLTYQWQLAPAGSANFTDIAGATKATYTTPQLALADNGNQYRCMVGALLTQPVAGAAATLTVTEDVTLPALVSAKTLGNPNQVIVVFSEPVLDPVASNFAIDNGIAVTGVVRGADTNTILVATAALTADKTFTLTVNGVKDRSGLEIAANSQIAIDTFAEVPVDYGQNVNGFQDDFSGATRDPNWVAVPADNDASYVQANGVLTVTTMALNPNHLLYTKPGYSDVAQEVLARIRLKTLPESGANAIIGAAVASSPDAAFPGDGINLLFVNTFAALGIEGLRAKFLDDHLAWGPTLSSFEAQFNTWYWLRLVQTTNVSGGTSNIMGKAWKADGTEPEPVDWQARWSRDNRAGFAGIKGPSDNWETEAEVDYILIKADGLPSIKVAATAFSLLGPRPEIIPPTIAQGATDNFIAFEAEGKVVLRTAPLTIWAVTNEVTASGASAIWAGGDNQTGFPSSFAIYALKFAQAGTYTVYYRWRADERITVSNNTGGNSFRLPVNFGDLPNDPTSTNFVPTASNATVPASNVYVVTQDTQTYTVTQAQVDAGQPLLFKIGTRELGMFLDRFVFSTDSALTEAAFNALPNSGASVLSIALQGNNVVVSWTGGGALQVAEKVTGPYTDMAGASPVTITPSESSRFYRVRQ